MKHSVRQIKMSPLEMEKVLRERLQADQVGGDDHGRGVVSAVVVRRSLGTRIVPFAESLQKLFKSEKRKKSRILAAKRQYRDEDIKYML